MSSQTTLSSRHAGDNAESAVLEAVPQLEYVPDTEAEHYDARATAPIEATDVLQLGELSELEENDRVEIKSAMVVYGQNQARGRFYLRRGQHERILEDGGIYLFAVCEPTPDRDVICLKALCASEVDGLVSSWIQPAGRAEYAQLAWSNVIDPETVEP